jgi:hypothetical protein
MAPTTAFVAKYGCLTVRANALAFRRDPDYPLLLSLEHYDEESDTARKAALFTQRTLSRVVEPSTRASRRGAGRVRPVAWPGRSGYMANCWKHRSGSWRHWQRGPGFQDPADGNGRPPTTTCRAT